MNPLFEKNIDFDNKKGVESKLIIGQQPSLCPLVSVVMPVYNHPDFLEKSLKSVVNQEGDIDYEIVIIDNGHPDFQKLNQAIVERYSNSKLRYYINEKNIGGVGSENRGVSLAKGKFITFCHDDDMLYPNALKTLINSIHTIGDENVAIFGNMTIVDENDKEIYRKDEFETLILHRKKQYRVTVNDILYRNYTNGCGSLYLRKNLISIGGYREEYIPCPDYALNCAYTFKYGAYAIKKKTLKYRVSSQSDTRNAYKYLVEGNRKITDSILQIGGIKSIINRPFVNIHLNVTNYHLYQKWSGNREGGFKVLVYRVINKIHIFISLILKSLR